MPALVATLSGSAIFASNFSRSARVTGAADAFEVGGDFVPDIAAVEILKAGMRELIERLGELLLRELRPDLRRLAVDQECLAETNRLVHFRQIAGRERGLAARHRIALTGTADRSFEQHVAAASSRRTACAACCASCQVATAPGTVSAASGPRVGISSWPCSR